MKNKFSFFALMAVLGSVSLWLNACEDPDPCEEVSCVRGSCVDGSCACPMGYEGEQCESEKEPSAITISSIAVNTYPEDNNGESWDEDGAPDLFLTMGVTDGDEIFSAAKFYEDVEPGFPYHFNSDIEISEVNKSYYIRLIDWDDSEPNLTMGEINVNLWESLKGKGFPEETSELIDGDTKIILTVSYKF